MMTWLELSEDVLVLKSDHAHALALAIRRARIKGVVDVVSSDDEVAVEHNHREVKELVKEISALNFSFEGKLETAVFEIPTCYELGEDLNEVLEITGLEREKFIHAHASSEYKAAFGFIPGFLYLSGLPERLQCPRRQTPRTKLPAGSVGIGGNKTGVYGLESPGGWQIIGRTPLSLFDINRTPPTLIPQNGKVKFVPISKNEFKKWDENS